MSNEALYIYGHVRWSIHVSARGGGICCQAMMSMSDPKVGDQCLVDILKKKDRLVRLFFGTMEVKWEMQNSPKTNEVCSCALNDRFTDNIIKYV